MNKSTALFIFGFSLLAQPAAKASLVCTAGNIVGVGHCVETVTLIPQKGDFSLLSMALDMWQTNASAPFSQTLSGATFQFSGSSSSSGSLTNSSDTTQSFTFTRSGALNFSAGAGAPSAFIPGGASVSASSATAVTTGAFSSSLYSDSLTLGPGALFAAANNLSQFVGASTFTVLVSSLTGSSFSGGNGFITSSLSVLYGPRVDVDYTFRTQITPTNAPEPGTFATLLSVIAGGAILARRRKRSGVSGGAAVRSLPPAGSPQ